MAALKKSFCKDSIEMKSIEEKGYWNFRLPFFIGDVGLNVFANLLNVRGTRFGHDARTSLPPF